MDELSFCVIGYGGIAAFHAEALRQIAGVRLHTVVGRRPEPAEEFRRQWGFETAATELDAALAPGVDAVVIAAPSELHHPMALAAVEAGKPVLVEIPLAMSRGGGEEIAALAVRTGTPAMVAHTRRFEETGQFVHDFLAQGRAGRVLQHHSYSFWLRHENVGWTGYQRSWVDDVLFHHGCHLVDFSLWCADSEVRRVRGELSRLDERTGTSMDVSMLLRYANDTIATISLSYNARQGAAGQRFICEKGLLEVRGGEVVFAGDTVFEAAGDGLRHGVLVQDQEFVDALREGRTPASSAAEAVRALAALQEVYDQMVTLDGEAGYRRPWGP